MQASVTVHPTEASSPRLTARIAGLFYLLMAVFGGAAGFARRGLIVAGDATVTAANIHAHQSLYLLAYAGDILMVASYVVVTALFYRVFKPVNKSVALTAAAFGLMGCAILAIAYSYELAPLALLGDAHYLGVFTVEQRQALSYVFLKFYSQTYGVSLVFFAFYLLLTGWLILRSTFLPRILGVFLMLGVWGLAFLSPPFAAKYLVWLRVGSMGELLLLLWLVVKGVDSNKWLRQASATRLAEAEQQQVPIS
jgi:uncharacterized protein DUF4386